MENHNNTLIGNGTTTWTLPITNGTTNQIYVGPSGSGSAGTIGVSGTYNINTSTQFTSNGKPVLEIPNNNDPSIKITGKIKWNGEDLQERLERIETLLNIPTRDAIMEEKYEKLRTLSNQYKQALEEYKTWERLKNSK